jgi:RHS repeat-associated protein
LTDRGFTGHKHDNLAGNDLGLIYMNARFYIPALHRFASADTIVPDPTNPQQYNRYTYVLNNPLRFSDPTGHCAGYSSSILGTSDDYDQECWDFLENEFCSYSGSDICGSGNNWRRWLYYKGWGRFGSAWNTGELQILSEALAEVITALENVDFDWRGTAMNNVKFRRVDRGEAGFFTVWGNIQLGSGGVNKRTIYHELGHAISNRFGPNDLHDIFDRESGNCGLIFCNRFAASGYYWREYGHSASTDGNGRLLGRQGETWGDAFAAWVFMEHQGRAPLQTDPNWAVIDSSLTVNWSGIQDAVRRTLQK